MAFTIHLFLDQKTEITIRAIWQALAEREITDYMYSSGNRPHITLAIFEMVVLEALNRCLRNIAEKCLALSALHPGSNPVPAESGI